MKHLIPITKSLTLKKLLLCLNINPEGMRLFAEASRHLGQLEYLNLNGESRITDSLWTHFAVAAKNMTSLTELEVSSHRVGQQMALFGESFQYFAGLKVLNLSFNHMGAKGMAEFADVSHHLTSLTKLTLNSNNLLDEGMIHFKTAAQHLPFLTKLELDNNGIGAGGINHLLKALAFLPLLKDLNLSDNEIDDDAMSHFANCASLGSLEYLCLTRNPIKSFGLRHLGLARMPSLTTLSLESIGYDSTKDFSNGIDCRGIHYLGDFKFESLKDLNLSGNNMGGSCSVDCSCCRMRKFVTASPSFASLKRLDLSFNDLGDKGMKYLARAAKNLTSLDHLDVSYNDLEDFDPLKKCLRHLGALKRVDLQYNDLEDEGLEYLSSLHEKKRKVEHVADADEPLSKKMKAEPES